MARSFGQKVALGFAVTVILTVAVSAVGIVALRGVVASKDLVIIVDAPLLADAERLRNASIREVSAARAIWLTREERYFNELRQARADFQTILERLKRNTVGAEAQRDLEATEQAETEHNGIQDRI